MTTRKRRAGGSDAKAPWQGEKLEGLIDELFDLNRSLMQAEEEFAAQLAELHPTHAAGGANLVHYMSSPGCLSTRLTNNSGFSLRHFCSA